MKWLQTESEHLQKLSDGEEITSIPSLSKLITDSQSYMSDSTTVPLSDKVGALIPSLSLITPGNHRKIDNRCFYNILMPYLHLIDLTYFFLTILYWKLGDSHLGVRDGIAIRHTWDQLHSRLTLRIEESNTMLYIITDIGSHVTEIHRSVCQSG